MNIIYDDDIIVDVKISNAAFNGKLTQPERLAFFGCATPNPTVWAAMRSLEQELSSITTAVGVMVSQGLITQARADEILA